jgi:hypothetical protein
MRLVILESPYQGDVRINERYARRAMRHCFSLGDAPIASHLLYTQEGILVDEEQFERELGIEAGLTWGSRAAVSVFYVDLHISNGMRIGYDRAIQDGRLIEMRSIASTRTLETDQAVSLDQNVANAYSVFGDGDAAEYADLQTFIREALKRPNWIELIPIPVMPLGRCR